MKALFVARAALADEALTSIRAGTQVIGPTITREVAGQTARQLSDAVATAMRCNVSADLFSISTDPAHTPADINGGATVCGGGGGLVTGES